MKQLPAHKWYDSLTMGQKMAIWNNYKAEGTTDFLDRAYKDYLSNFKLKIA